MVASFTGQVIWQDYSYDHITDKNPIGWIDTNIDYHEITSDMMSGYLGMDAKYYATQPSGQSSVAIAKLATSSTDAVPVKTKPTWNLSFQLTKELGRIANLSLYVNNMLFYEPFRRASNTTTTLSQRNTNNFSYGVELSFNL
jgi:hypothetical protein